MELPPLGGHKNPYETKRSTENRMESTEDGLEFGEYRKEFNNQASKIFCSGDDTMSKLRSSQEFQSIKTGADYEDYDRLEMLAVDFQGLIEKYNLIDVRDLAALLSVLAQADRLQDDRLHKQSALKRAA